MSEHNEIGAKHVFYAVVIMAVAGCVSCSGANKPSLKGLIDEMAGNCGANGTSVQKAEPSSEQNDEIKAKVEIHCFPPPVRYTYGTQA